MKLAFVVSHCPDPRINKRISLLKKQFQLSLLYWNRDRNFQYKVEHNDIENKEIVVPANFGNALNRIVPTFTFARSVIKELNRIKPDIIYVGNVDMLSIIWIYYRKCRIKPKVIYEVADLHTLIIDKHKNPIKKYTSFILRAMEKKLCNIIDMLVLTSEKFHTLYYSEFIPASKVFIMPNIPSPEPFKAYKRKENKESFTVGFIGAVRYKEQMRMLINAMKNSGIKVFFAGAGNDDEIERLTLDNNGVEYHGKYNYETEIAKLYGQVDCIYSVYDADLNNVRIALPNKLYESIYCELPIIVAKGTYLSELVEEMGVGIAVNHRNAEELKEVIFKLSNDNKYYNSIIDNCKSNKEFVNISKYNEQLATRIQEL